MWPPVGPCLAAVVYYKAYSSNPLNVARNGTLLVNVGSLSAVVNSSQWYWDSGRGRLYLYGNPSADTVEVGARQYALNTNSKSYLTFNDLDLEGGTDAICWFSSGSGNITMQNCHVKNGDNGIDISSTAGNNCYILSNHFEYCYINGIALNAGNATGWRIANNEINNWGVSSAQILNGLSPQGVYVHMNGRHH